MLHYIYIIVTKHTLHLPTGNKVLLRGYRGDCVLVYTDNKVAVVMQYEF